MKPVAFMMQHIRNPALVGVPWFVHPPRSRPLLLHADSGAKAVAGCPKQNTSPRDYTAGLSVHRRSSGQALVVLLVFMVVSITLTTMAVALTIINATAASGVEQGDMALKLAESGAENALLRLVRNPSYAGTESFSLDGGTVTATVSAGNPIIITSRGTVNSFVRSLRVSAVFVDTVLTIQNWREEF